VAKNATLEVPQWKINKIVGPAKSRNPRNPIFGSD